MDTLDFPLSCSNIYPNTYHIVTYHMIYLPIILSLIYLYIFVSNISSPGRDLFQFYSLIDPKSLARTMDLRKTAGIERTFFFFQNLERSIKGTDIICGFSLRALDFGVIQL